MKVIGFTSNYGDTEVLPQAYLMADSSILYNGRPFFLPDYARHFKATPTIVVRTGRLGKCIAPKFAHRYWDAFTAAFTVRAVESDDGRLTALDRAFDGALIVGDWVEHPGGDAAALESIVELALNDGVVANCRLADMRHPLADLLSAVSTRCSIKMGDVLVTGDAATGRALSPGDRLTARVNGKPVLDVKVRL